MDCIFREENERRTQRRGRKRKRAEANPSVRSYHFMIDGRCEQLRLIIRLYSAALFEASGCVRMCVRGSACMWVRYCAYAFELMGGG